MDELIKKLQELTDAIQGGKDNATTNMDGLKAEFAVVVKAIGDLQAQANAPRYRGMAGNGIPAESYGTVSKSNRYHRHIKAFGEAGFYRDMNVKVQPVDLWLAHRLMSKAYAMAPDRAAAPSADLDAALKALSDTATGAGDEYVPTNMAAQLWLDFFMQSRVAGSIMPITMTSNPMDIPAGFGAPTWRKGTANQAISSPDMATSKSTLTATELVATQAWSYTLDEDSVVALMPAMRIELGRSGAEMIDDFAINADSTNAATGNVNSDDGDPADDSFFLTDGQNGIRRQHLVDNTAMTINAAAALTPTIFSSALVLMGKYATDPMNTVITCDIGTYLNGFLNSTNFPEVATIEKFGANATVLTGQLATYRGMPIIPSPVYRLSEADGKQSVTAGNNTKGGLSIYHRAMWNLGFRRDLLIEIDRDIQKRQFILVASMREAIAARGTRSTNTHTAGIRNITV